jgi:hypothetical protein
MYRMLVGGPEGKRLCGRPRHRWEDNIEIVLKGVYWINMAQEKDLWQVLVTMVINLWIQ